MIKVQVGNLARSVVPGPVFRQPAFNYEPEDFQVLHPKYEDKFIDSSVIENSLEEFTSNPTVPCIYGVTGNPDDSKALYFAAHLVETHIKKVPSHKVAWVPLYGNFRNPYLDEPQDLSLIVLVNITSDSTPAKMEKAKDLLYHYADIPRIVVGAGTDPVTLVSCQLFSPINFLAYFPSKSVRVEI